MNHDILMHLDNIEYQSFGDVFAAAKGLGLFEHEYANWSKEDKDQLLYNLKDAKADFSNPKRAIHLVAYYILCHRIICNRKGHVVDDYIKAKYLVANRDKIEKKHREFWLTRDIKMEHLINEVNNIFDSAYFKKQNHPEFQDDFAFFEAERESYDIYKEVELLANRRYLWRIEKNILGNDVDDWVYAEKQYPEWKTKKQIAEVCWLLSDDKQKDSDAYWTMASMAINEIEKKENRRWIVMDPSEPPILDYIKTIVRKKESMLRNNSSKIFDDFEAVTELVQKSFAKAATTAVAENDAHGIPTPYTKNGKIYYRKPYKPTLKPTHTP